jgi:hypothetical protein
VSKTSETAPERIYLNLGFDTDVEDDVPFSELAEVTWCEDAQGKSDIEYMRADLSPVLVLGEAVAWMWEYSGEHVTRDKGQAEAIRTYGVNLCPLYLAPAEHITLAELEAKDSRIAELERAQAYAMDKIQRLTERLAQQPVSVPERTGVGDLCAPGPADQQKQRYLVLFDDADMGISYFDDEATAREFFAVAEGRGYNCYLFELSKRSMLAAAPEVPK